MLRRIAQLGVAAGLLLSTAAGCGKSTPFAELRGKVTLDGRPVYGYNIKFMVPGGQVDTAVMTEDGKYVSYLAPKGVAKVFFSKAQVPAPMQSAAEIKLDAQGRPIIPAPGKKPVMTGPAMEIPAKYLSMDTSGLEVEIKAGENTKDFELTSN